MGKSKASKNGENVPQRHLHSRISFLHQAAAYLATNESNGQQPKTLKVGNGSGEFSEDSTLSQEKGYGQSRHLLNQLRGVSKKSQIRLAGDIKHTVCKRCDSLLVSGESSLEEVKNDSKGARKPWADVFEIKCKTCGIVKRFPTGQQRVQKIRFKKELPSSKKQKGKKAT